MIEGNFGQTPLPIEQPDIFTNQEKQLQLALKLKSVYETRPEMDNFVGAMAGTKFAAEYSPEQIERDQNYVEDTRRKIEEVNSNFGQDKKDKMETGFALSEMG